MSAESASERLARLSRPRRCATGARGRSCARRSAAPTEALEELFRRHWRRAHRAAYLVVGDPAAAEDIAQESFLAAIRALDRFDRRRPFGPWLHRITVNRSIDFARARACAARACPREPQPTRREPPSRTPTLRRAARGARRARARAPGGGRAAPPARLHAGRDRRDPRAAAGHRQLATAARPRPAAAGDREGSDEPRPRHERELRGPCGSPGEDEAGERVAGGRQRRVRRANAGAPGRRARRLALALAGGIAALAIGLSPAGAKVGDLVEDVISPASARRTRSRRCARCPPPASCWSSPARASGSSARTARSGCSATTARRAGRRTASSSRRRRPPAGRGRPARRRALDGHRAGPRERPALVAERLPDRLPQRRRPPGRRRRRHRAIGCSPATSRRSPRRGGRSATRSWPRTAPAATCSPISTADMRVRAVDVDSGERRQSDRRRRRALSTPTASDRPGASRRTAHACLDPRPVAAIELVLREAAADRGSLFSARGPLTGPTWSPDGRWLLVGWPRGRSVAVHPRRPARRSSRSTASPSSSTRAATGEAAFPRVAGWVLPQRWRRPFPSGGGRTLTNVCSSRHSTSHRPSSRPLELARRFRSS